MRGMFALRNTCAKDTGDRELCTQKEGTTTDRVNSCGHVLEKRVSARVTENKTPNYNTWYQQISRPWAEKFEKTSFHKHAGMDQSLNNKTPNLTSCQNSHDAIHEAVKSDVRKQHPQQLQAVRFLRTFCHHPQDKSSPCLNFPQSISTL